MQALTFEGRYEELASTIADFAYHVGQAVQDVSHLAQRDPEQARLLAAELRFTLSKHTGLVDILACFAPAYAQAYYERVQLVSQDGVLRIHDALSPGSSGAQSLALRVMPSENVRWARPGEPGPVT